MLWCTFMISRWNWRVRGWSICIVPLLAQLKPMSRRAPAWWKRSFRNFEICPFMSVVI